ncbi:hypothetical protein PQI07_27140 [Methylobacterium sp. 092160098-2]|uniref:hypothetical protein n=1 Tax=Methylobacterium sp. 092160098-2 TaxID=3025129 RepID=UPI002381B72C|nr:hypothetical protein [Methylobacterium sp. 092160098-2]MDE4914350.1 hypothetical protein [Methylobacterium sp. 092160098-2]
MGDVVQLPVVDRRDRAARLTAMSAAEIGEIVVAHDQAVAEGAIDEVERLGNLLDEIGRERRLAGLPERPAA